jgi:hypothetical protein
MITDAEIERFVTDGYVAIRGAVPAPVVQDCRVKLEDELRARGVDPLDSATWTEPVVRFWCPATPPFARAGTQAVLWEAYDRLIGPGRRVEYQGVGGSVPVRFPSEADPGDAGWHIDGSIPMGDTWGVNVRSAGRGLLALFLFSDVGPDDAPTELKVGSHLLIPPTLIPFGEAGGLHDLHRTGVYPAVEALPSALATGAAGDVFLCHPFIAHRATWPHRGTQPRFLAQPAIGIDRPFELTGEGDVPPVERAILQGLGGRPPDLAAAPS